jgi:hypothetical protein
MKLHIAKDIFAVVSASVALGLLTLPCVAHHRFQKFFQMFMFVILLVDGTFLTHHCMTGSTYHTELGFNHATFLFFLVLLYPLYVCLQFISTCCHVSKKS